MGIVERRVVVGAALVLSLSGLAAAGCDDAGQGPRDGQGEWTTQQSDLSRNLHPQVTPAEMTALVRGDYEFTLNLYHEVEGEPGNLFLSPYSIRTAFAMAYAGAEGQTATEIAEVMRFTLEEEAFHEAMNEVDLELARRNLVATHDQDAVELHVANAFWGREGDTFREDYLDLLAVNYGSCIRTLDFIHAPEPSRKTINDWVAVETRNRILDLLPPGSIDPAVVAVLTNALYFKAPWETPFEKTLTVDAAFTRLDGSQVTAPMMHQTEIHEYTDGPGYQALELEYRGKDLSMVILLPSEGSFEDFQGSLDADGLGAILDGLSKRSVVTALPKFGIESGSLSLKDTLVAMGMVTPFGGEADFTGMYAPGGIYIDDAYHKTFVAVDEKGTEAAAATAIVFREVSIPSGPEVEFTADRPFLFLIRDRGTGTILFFGRVLDPVAE